MNKLLLAVSIFALSTATAMAADLAARPYTKAPAMAVAAYDWSGFYIGGKAAVHGAISAGMRTRSLFLSSAFPRTFGGRGGMPYR